MQNCNIGPFAVKFLFVLKYSNSNQIHHHTCVFMCFLHFIEIYKDYMLTIITCYDSENNKDQDIIQNILQAQSDIHMKPAGARRSSIKISQCFLIVSPFLKPGLCLPGVPALSHLLVFRR